MYIGAYTYKRVSDVKSKVDSKKEKKSSKKKSGKFKLKDVFSKENVGQVTKSTVYVANKANMILLKTIIRVLKFVRGLLMTVGLVAILVEALVWLLMIATAYSIQFIL